MTQPVNRIQITRRIEFDAGHRIPDHRSQCRNLHGHRYALEVTVSGEVKNRPGDPENGMVIDFGALKDIVKFEVADPWDHAFLVYREDRVVMDLLAAIPGHKTVVLDVTPTAENLAREAARRIEAALAARYGTAVKLERLRLYETPNCWADVPGAA